MAVKICMVFKDSLCFPHCATVPLPALGVCFILPVHASSPKHGDFANTQARHIATFFPGRMTGTPAEMLSADYIRQQFQQMGYRSDIRTFNSRYIYTARDNRKSWHNVTEVR